MNLTKLVILSFIVILSACGPNCYNEKRELNDCLNLTVIGVAACTQNATTAAQSTNCTNGLFAGMIGCNTQVHPGCTY